MGWENVRVFVAAAKRLKLDDATVSRRIAALEATIGAKLFDRRRQGSNLPGRASRSGTR